MIRVLPLFASVAVVAFSSDPAFGFTLVGSELKVGYEIQAASGSQLFTETFPSSAIVSESLVEFPSAVSLFGVNPAPGFITVEAAIDAGADYLRLDYASAAGFSNLFKNSYVFTFTQPVALQITDVLIDPSSTALGLTPERVTFDGNKLFVNVRGLFFNRNSFVRFNLTTVTATESDIPIISDADVTGVAAIPEPSSMLGLGIVALGGTMFKRYASRRRSEPKSLEK